MKSLVCLLAASLASCAPNVFVVDQDGYPVEDAEIRRQARSFNYAPIKTDANGAARINQDLPTVETLHVWKNGYTSPDPVNFNLPKPITVVLRR